MQWKAALDTYRQIAALSPADERARGLMGVEHLPPDVGMVFVWPEPVRAQLWMKDTPLPLSVAWWDEGGRIVAIAELEPCRADPCPSYPAPAPIVGAVETHAGWFSANGVEVGDRVQLRGRDG